MGNNGAKLLMMTNAGNPQTLCGVRAALEYAVSGNGTRGWATLSRRLPNSWPPGLISQSRHESEPGHYSEHASKCDRDVCRYP
jgi:hypothetical protein